MASFFGTRIPAAGGRLHCWYSQPVVGTPTRRKAGAPSLYSPRDSSKENLPSRTCRRPVLRHQILSFTRIAIRLETRTFHCPIDRSITLHIGEDHDSYFLIHCRQKLFRVQRLGHDFLLSMSCKTLCIRIRQAWCMIGDDGCSVQHVHCGWTGITIAFCGNFDNDPIFFGFCLLQKIFAWCITFRGFVSESKLGKNAQEMMWTLKNPQYELQRRTYSNDIDVRSLWFAPPDLTSWYPFSQKNTHIHSDPPLAILMVADAESGVADLAQTWTDLRHFNSKWLVWAVPDGICLLWNKHERTSIYRNAMMCGHVMKLVNNS